MMFIINLTYSFLDQNCDFFSVADPGCLSRIRFFSILDPGSASKNLSILTQKMASKLSEMWFGLFIQDPDGYGSWLFTLPGSRISNQDPGVKKAPDPGPQHWIFLFVFHTV